MMETSETVGLDTGADPGSNVTSEAVNKSQNCQVNPQTNISGISHSDSGIVVTPLSPANQKSPSKLLAACTPDSATSFSPVDNVAPQEDESSASLSQSSAAVGPVPGGVVFNDSSSRNACSNSLDYVSNTLLLSPRLGQHRMTKSPKHRLLLPRSKNLQVNFAYETKYVVLQFLHHTTSEQSIMGQSQNSLSTMSESEPHRKSYSRAQVLQVMWQSDRSSSVPTSPKKDLVPPLVKTKRNRSSPDLKKDDNFVQDVSPSSIKKRLSISRPLRKGRKVTHPKSKAPQPSVFQKPAEFIRSISNYTENSENGTYNDDADDELNTSFDSSLQGSITSHSLRDRMVNVHAKRLPTVPSEYESMAEYGTSVGGSTIVGDSLGFAVNDHEADEAVTLDMIQIEDTPLSPVDAYNRVQNYPEQMSDCMSEPVPCGLFENLGNPESTPDMTFVDGLDELDGPPFEKTVIPNDSLLEIGEFQTAAIEAEEDVEGTPRFYQSSGSGSPPPETEGACGGGDEDDGVAEEANDNDAGFARTADRSRLTLDLQCHDDSATLVDAVLSLQQELEEEISEFESEFEEAMQGLMSDGSRSLSPGHSRSFSPDTAEVARILARIGDDVQERYFKHLEIAVGRLLIASCNTTTSLFTYEHFCESAMMVLEDSNLTNWWQVAMLLLYSQHVALHLAQCGRQSLHRIIDYTVKLLADKAADFILRQGGWAAISSLDHSTSSSPEESGPVHIPFTGEVHSTGVDPLELLEFLPNFQQSSGDGASTGHWSSGDVSASTSRSEGVPLLLPSLGDLDNGSCQQASEVGTNCLQSLGDVCESTLQTSGTTGSHHPADLMTVASAFMLAETPQPPENAQGETTPTDVAEGGAANDSTDSGMVAQDANLVSTVQNIVANSNLAAGLAVSGVLVAVGVAVMLNFARS